MDSGLPLYIFHYHLLPGGVTTVIRDGARALLAHRNLIPDLTRLVVVAAGPDDGGLGVLGRRPGSELPLDRCRLDAVGYEDAPATQDGQRQLADLLRRRFGDGVWWIHNHHLAKNTRFTGAVLLAAAAGQPMVLQIHDFPENARPANLARLLREVPGSPYPGGDNVRYAVLNRRDYSALVAAGCPADRIALLANPVRPAAPVPAPDAEPARATRARLQDTASAREPAGSEALLGTGHYDPERPLWLYPVRVRRRKNVLEAGLLARLAGANVVVTLPASSAAETPYSRQVERLFACGAIPGLYGVGEHLDAHGLRFDDLLAAAHLIVSPSVEEGFGFQFVNALQWRRPLLARRLPVLDDLAALLDGYPATVYGAVHCPLAADLRRELRAAYAPVVERAARQLPDAAGARLRAELDGILAGDTVDFSYLGAPHQEALLWRCGDGGMLREMRLANAELLDTVQARAHRPPPDRAEQIDAAYGASAFARRSGELLAPLLAAATDARRAASAADAPDAAIDPDATGRSSATARRPVPSSGTAGSADGAIDPVAVRRAFARPAAIRLLMEN